MKRKFMWISLVLTAMLTGCDHPNTIKTVYVGVEQKVVLNPDLNDVIKWAKPDGSPVPVSFFPPSASPCKKDDPVGQCTISVDKARVLYKCDHCADPEIVVGSDISTLGQASAAAAGNKAPTATLFVACVANQIVIVDSNQNSGSDIKIPKPTTLGDVSIAWQSLGSPALKDWKADTFSTDLCTPNPPFNDGNPTCTVKTTASGTTTYNVSAPTCTTPLNGAKITIMP